MTSHLSNNDKQVLFWVTFLVMGVKSLRKYSGIGIPFGELPSFFTAFVRKLIKFVMYCNCVSDDVTLAIVPGICNTSESVYIRVFVHYAQCHGYRCAVLNHIGALSSVPVTSSRIFTYGKVQFKVHLICSNTTVLVTWLFYIISVMFSSLCVYSM